MKWGGDPRFEALERKDREVLLNERYFLIKKKLVRDICNFIFLI